MRFFFLLQECTRLQEWWHHCCDASPPLKKRVYKTVYYTGAGFHQHVGNPNGFPRSALLCWADDFKYGKQTPAQDGAVLISLRAPGMGKPCGFFFKAGGVLEALYVDWAWTHSSLLELNLHAHTVTLSFALHLQNWGCLSGTGSKITRRGEISFIYSTFVVCYLC